MARYLRPLPANSEEFKSYKAGVQTFELQVSSGMADFENEEDTSEVENDLIEREQDFQTSSVQKRNEFSDVVFFEVYELIRDHMDFHGTLPVEDTSYKPLWGPPRKGKTPY